MNDYAGESGGGSSAPLPNIEYEAVEMDTVSVKAFGDALMQDANNMRTASKDIQDQLAIGAESGDKFSQYKELPVGTDPRQETLHDIVVQHSQRMVDTKTLLGDVATSIHNVGLMCKYIADQFGDKDQLNALSIDQVKGIIGDASSQKSGEV